ncbi:MAG: HD domain-containing protein [Desulfovibrionaceae bacterium]|nr:HD domain-containing protein [Desulfovibrionaceae bacterium]
MLKSTPRTGWAFLGSNQENVAEHSYRTAVIAYILARLAEIDPAKVVFLALFHDLHEARTGDFNYVYHRYNKTKAKEALSHATEGTGLAYEILDFYEEFSKAESKEALLANDADQLDLIANLAKELAKGNSFAREWLDSALPRLKTKEAQDLATALLKVDPNNWWYGEVEKSFWIHHS